MQDSGEGGGLVIVAHTLCYSQLKVTEYSRPPNGLIKRTVSSIHAAVRNIYNLDLYVLAFLVVNIRYCQPLFGNMYAYCFLLFFFFVFVFFRQTQVLAP